MVMNMKLKRKNQKIEIKVCDNFSSRFKSLKFYLEKLDFGLYFPKRKFANTYFFCQRVDLCFTDKEEKIKYLFQNVKSEKIIWKRKSKNLYILPRNSTKDWEVGESLKITQN